MAHPHISIRRAKPLLGTFVEISASGASEKELETAVEAAFGAIAKVHRLMSFHEAASDVARLNREASAAAIKVDAWTVHVLEAALDLHRRSGGIFDVTTASALQRRGILPDVPACDSRLPRDGDGLRRHSKGISASMRDRITTWSHPKARIEILPDCHVRFHSADILIDLGGIAKGFAVDCAIDILRERDIPTALVNAGGDLAAFGPESYPIQIRDPRRPDRVLCEIGLQNEALATSASRLHPFHGSAAARAEIIDPRTQNAPTSIAGATVCATACMIADALTKAVMIAGHATSALLDRYNANALMISGDGSIDVSPGLQGAIDRAT